MKSTILIFLFSILSFHTVISQTNDSLQAEINTAKLTGYVVDSKNFTPLLNANCSLFKDKDTMASISSKTESSGFFILDKIPFGTYKLEIECVGYTSFTLDNIKFDENNNQKNLDTVKLKRSEITTEEVLVEGEKPILTFEGEKKVFDVTQSIISKGGTALDVLKKVPMVDVDINDNVTLRGSQNVKILINDKPNRFINLKQIPADEILKVELITNPPAKYESEGVTGIINLVMKKNDAVGYNGYIYGSIGTLDRYYAGGNLNFKKDKINIYTGGYYGVYHYHSNYSSYYQYLSPVISYLDESGTYSGVSKYPSIDGGLEYEVKKDHTIGIEAYYNNSRYESPNHSLNQSFNVANTLTSYYTEDGSYNGTWKSYTMSLYYNGKLNDKGKEISGDITYSGNSSDYDNDDLRRDYDSLSQPVNNTPHHQIDNGTNKTDNLNMQVDYTHPFGKLNRIETGYKGTFRINDNNYQSDTLNYSLGGYFNNINVSNHFKLTETINSGYFIFGSKIKDFSYKLGLRVENTNAKSELLTEGQSFTKNYTDFFPTVNLSQQVGQANQIQLSYSRRITRPNIYRLNPFVQRSDPKFIYVGNPYLNPEFTDSYELSYMLFMKGFSITPSGFFRRTHDVISNYSYLTDSGVTVTTYKNATGSNSYGLDLIGNTRTPEWLNLNGTLSFYETVFDKDLVTDYAAEQGFSWKANIRAFISIGKIFKIEMFYRYNGKKVNAQGTTMASSSLDIGFSTNFLNEKVTASFRASDIFSGMKWGQNVNGVGYNSSFQNTYDTRSYFLNISYRFGNTDESYQKKKNTKENENEGTDQVDEGKNK